MLYFDHAATTPVHPDVAEKMDQVSRLDYGNPSSIYSSGRLSKSIIESARNQTAKMIDAHPSEIFLLEAALSLITSLSGQFYIKKRGMS